jgi:hypothetical protein
MAGNRMQANTKPMRHHFFVLCPGTSHELPFRDTTSSLGLCTAGLVEPIAKHSVAATGPLGPCLRIQPAVPQCRSAEHKRTSAVGAQPCPPGDIPDLPCLPASLGRLLWLAGAGIPGVPVPCRGSCIDASGYPEARTRARVMSKASGCTSEEPTLAAFVRRASCGCSTFCIEFRALASGRHACFTRGAAGSRLCRMGRTGAHGQGLLHGRAT